MSAAQSRKAGRGTSTPPVTIAKCRLAFSWLAAASLAMSFGACTPSTLPDDRLDLGNVSECPPLQ
ncbi:MAG: hypothetical protein D6806_17105, partial [Deltaproteobacteria bacterium]